MDDIEILKAKIENTQMALKRILDEKDAFILLALEKEKAKKKEKPREGLTFYVENSCILVGRNAKENDKLLRSHVRGNDWWLHTRDTEGGFVFIKGGKGEYPKENVVKAAANLALYYSKSRKNGKASLYMTNVKNLRRIKNAKTGKVSVTHERNLFVTLDEKLIKELKLSLSDD